MAGQTRYPGGARNIGFLAIAQTIFWAGQYYLFPALLVRWEKAFGWSRSEITLALLIALATSAALSPVFGRLIDKGRGALVLAGTGLGGGAALLLLAFVDELWQFYVVWFVIGLMNAGCLYDPCFAFVTRCRGAGAKKSITMITIIAGFAGTVSFPSCHALAEAFDWRAAALFWGVAAILIAAPLTWAAAGDMEARRASAAGGGAEGAASSGKRFLKRPAFWLLSFGLALLYLNHGMIVNHLLPLLEERQVDPDAAVLAISMIGPMQVLGRLAMAAIGDHVSTMAMTAGVFVVLIAAGAVLLFGGAVPVLLAVFVVLQGGGNGVLAIMRPVVSREILGERDFGAKFGAMSVSFIGLFAVAPFAGSLLWRAGGYDLMLLAVCAAPALGLALFLSAVRAR